MTIAAKCVGARRGQPTQANPLATKLRLLLPKGSMKTCSARLGKMPNVFVWSKPSAGKLLLRAQETDRSHPRLSEQKVKAIKVLLQAGSGFSGGDTNPKLMREGSGR